MENSGHCGFFGVPNVASASEQAVLPSAAFGLIENPSGRLTVGALISESEGESGLSDCGTLRSMSSPEAVSASVVVGVPIGAG